MTGRPGLFGGFRQSDTLERDDAGFGLPGQTLDPVWGSLGPPTEPTPDAWNTSPDDMGPEVDVEVFGNGFQISGQIRTGSFNRLSDWLNMQTGFIQLREASVTHLGHANLPDPEHQHGTMWIRLNQVVLVAERGSAAAAGASGMVVQKQKRRATIVLPGYSLRGSLHVHAHGSLQQFLETPDPKFIPVTDLVIRWTDDPAVMARFPLGLINREQLVSLLEEQDAPGEGAAGSDETDLLHRQFGAA